MRKPVYTREDVAAAGLAVVRAEGLGQLTARRVADELASSTAPVYSNFANMEELEEAVLRRAVRELFGLMREKHTEDEFLNMGIGVLKFATREPQLYSALFFEGHGDNDPGSELFAQLVEVMQGMDTLDPLPMPERILMLKKMAIFTTGMATMLCRTCHGDCDEELHILLMREVGEAVFEHASGGVERAPADARRMATMLDEIQAELEATSEPEEDVKP